MKTGARNQNSDSIFLHIPHLTCLCSPPPAHQAEARGGQRFYLPCLLMQEGPYSGAVMLMLLNSAFCYTMSIFKTNVWSLIFSNTLNTLCTLCTYVKRMEKGCVLHLLENKNVTVAVLYWPSPQLNFTQSHHPSLISLGRLVFGRLILPHGFEDVIWNLFHGGLITLNMQWKCFLIWTSELYELWHKCGWLPNLTFVTSIATPSGRFLSMYSR